MSSKSSLHLFSAYGIELEYMLVNKDTLAVLPVTDEVIHRVAKKYVSDVDMGEIEWSNELVLHVIELKTNGPAKDLTILSELFHKNIKHVNQLLDSLDGRLMPGAMHPFMDPDKEMKLWPYDSGPVYEAYNSIFDCRGHGWANLQSMHINLPFANDEEFGKLHAAIRLLLPILPALAAASPMAGKKLTGFSDYRLEVYRNNQQKVPSIAGRVIPEQAFTKTDYEEKILKPLYKDISAYDKMGTLQHEWLNSRGAIARFERNAIEIRVLDIQECPKADIAIAAFIIEVIKALVSEKWVSYKEQKQFHENELSDIFLDSLKTGERSIIKDSTYLNAFGIDKENLPASELLSYLYNELAEKLLPFKDILEFILKNGSLSTRITKAIKNDTSEKNIKKVYGKLCECLSENKMFSNV